MKCHPTAKFPLPSAKLVFTDLIGDFSDFRVEKKENGDCVCYLDGNEIPNVWDYSFEYGTGLPYVNLKICIRSFETNAKAIEYECAETNQNEE